MSEIEMRKNMRTTRFTFGSDHRMPDGSSAWGKHVVVVAPTQTDARAVFMGWLGSNAFSWEYDETEWADRDMVRHYPGEPDVTIRIEVA